MQTTGPEKIRLQKFMAHAGACSRRKAEEHILKGRVKVNGIVVTKLGTSVDPESDKVWFDGRQLTLTPEKVSIYIMLNKPAGVVSSCRRQNSKIVLDLVRIKDRIFPVGRLDKDSQGLLLLTNDGPLHHRLSHPGFNHEKEYVVSASAPLSNRDLSQMAKGMVIDGEKTRPAKVRRRSPNSFTIILKQGRNRQIRKMVALTGKKVRTLKRVRIAGIRLGSLKEGSWRYLTTDEIRLLTQ